MLIIENMSDRVRVIIAVAYYRDAILFYVDDNIQGVLKYKIQTYSMMIPLYSSAPIHNCQLLSN